MHLPADKQVQEFPGVADCAAGVRAGVCSRRGRVKSLTPKTAQGFFLMHSPGQSPSA